ncbi:MAG: hypothetical protein CNLJKLNK_00866 [Holosporales bacterium]
MITELQSINSLDHNAEEQIKKMLRNARFGNGNNRFESSCMGDDDLMEVIQKKLQKIIPTYLPDQRTTLDQTALPADMPPLVPVNDFIESYTDQGVLYHGTKDLMNLLAILRNGFYISQNGQGAAAFGSGVYTTKDKSTAEEYAIGGIVLPLTVRRDLDLRILNKKDPATQTWHNIDNETLAKTYGIDIIINEYVILQNARVIKKQKNVTDIIRAIQNDMIQKIHTSNVVDFNQAVLILSPHKGYSLLAKAFDPNYQAPDERFLKLKAENHLINLNIEESLRSYIIENFDFLSSFIDFDSDKEKIEKGIIFTRKNEDIAKDFFAAFDYYSTAIQFLMYSPKREKIESLIQLVKAGVLHKIDMYDLYRGIPTLNKEQVDVLVYLAKENIINNISVNELENIPKDVSMGQANILAYLVNEDLIDKTNLIFSLKEFPKDFSMAQANILTYLVNKGLIDKRNLIFSLKEFPKDITMDQVEILNYMVNEDLIDKMYLINSLAHFPNDFTMKQANILASLVTAGVIDKISIIELKVFPKNFSIEQAKILINLTKEGVLDKKYLIYKLKDFVENFNIEKEDLIIKLYKDHVIGKTFMNNLVKITKLSDAELEKLKQHKGERLSDGSLHFVLEAIEKERDTPQ